MIVFDINCTLPNSVPVFVSDSNTRGTLDIVFANFSILILCMVSMLEFLSQQKHPAILCPVNQRGAYTQQWSVLRLNVPLQTTPQTSIQRFRKDLHAHCIKLGWMVITLLVPESAFGRAVVNLHSCLFHTTQLEELALQDGVPWSRYHTYLADMGGFVLTFPRPTGDGGRQHEFDDSQDISVDKEAGERNKPPSLPCVAVIPLSPISLGHSSLASPVHHSGDRPSSPDHRYSDTSFGCGTVDIEAGSFGLSSPYARLSRADSDAGSSSSSSSIISSPTATSTEVSRPTQDKTMYHGTSKPRALLSGKDWGETYIRSARLRYIEGKARHYGPVAWNPHPDLVALSKMLIASMTNASSTSPPTEDPTALPPEMHKTHLIRHLISLEGDATPLCAAQLIEARRLGLISYLPYLTEAMVRDRDKGNTLVKLAAVWQTIWLAIDLAVRQAAGLPSSPLEFVVLAFSVLALATYLLNWFAPKDVQTLFYVPSTRLPTANELYTLAILRLHANGTCPGSFAHWCIPSVDARRAGYLRATRVWLAGGAWSGMVFGSLHLLAWNFAFPTAAEKWLWRAAGLMTAVWPLIPGIFGWCVAMLRRRLGKKAWLSQAAVIVFSRLFMVPVLLVIPLLCARVFLLVEAYRSLYYLPPESYVTTWTSNVPRFG